MHRFFTVTLFILLIFTSPVKAEISFETKTTPKEKAVFAFFRAINSSPDYEYWIKSNPAYDALPPKKQETYLLREIMRLGYGYGLYDKNKDILELKIDVLVRYIPAGDENEKARILFKFFDNSEEYTPTFDYPYGSDVISLVINRLAAFSNMSLNEAQSKAIASKVPYENDDFDATLIIHVRVSKAMKDPVRTDPFSQWIMIGDIAYLECRVNLNFTNQKYTLWDYVAPWYKEEFLIKNMPEEEKYPHPFDLFKD